MPPGIPGTAPKLSIFKWSLGLTFVVVGAFLAAILFIGAPPADAAVCTWSAGVTTPTNWTNPANWTCVGAPVSTFAGQNPGDSAQVSTNQVIQVTSLIPNAVALTIPSGSS